MNRKKLRRNINHIWMHAAPILATLLPVCYGQDISQNQQIVGAVRQWEGTAKVEVPADTLAKVTQKVNDTNSRASESAKQEIAGPNQSKVVTATTFVILNSALKAEIDKKGGGTPSRVTQLGAASVEAVNATQAASFLSSADGFGYLTIDSIPSQAEVWIDGHFLGYTKTILGLTTGQHVYEVRFASKNAIPTCRGNIGVEKSKSYQRSCP